MTRKFWLWVVSIILLSLLVAVWIAAIWIAVSLSLKRRVIAPIPPEGTTCPAGRSCFAIAGSSDGDNWTGDGCLYLYPPDFADGGRHQLNVTDGKVFFDGILQIPVACRKVTPK